MKKRYAKIRIDFNKEGFSLKIKKKRVTGIQLAGAMERVKYALMKNMDESGEE